MSETDITELDLVVGSMITTRPDEDRSIFEEERESVAQVQDQLREEGVEIDLLAQPGTEVWEGGIETLGALYQLSRFAAHLERGDDIAGVLDDGPVLYDELDPAIISIWERETETRFAHLINLQGVNSYYLPVDFAEPIPLVFEDENGEEDEALFCSSYRLQHELAELAPMLREAHVPLESDAYRCLEVLRNAADQSLQFGLPIIVW